MIQLLILSLSSHPPWLTLSQWDTIRKTVISRPYPITNVLFDSTKKGNRTSYSRSVRPEIAISLYEQLITKLVQDLGKPVQTGEFGADMKVTLTNDASVIIIIDTKNRE